MTVSLGVKKDQRDYLHKIEVLLYLGYSTYETKYD